MNVTPLQPDAGPQSASPDAVDGELFASILDGVGTALARADRAERAFAERKGGLVEMIVERAGADVMLGIAVAGAQRTTQAISTLLGMQV
ncbi:MAG: hypothetical protein JO359_12860 [Candidatus Eremiobacteraeota bacterium]|nr:hypothetical protein [Candidatus Eremiobacteraeota bacterium]